MRTLHVLSVLFSVACCNWLYAQEDREADGKEVIQHLIKSVKDLQTCQFEMKSKERIDNTYVFTHSVASIRFEPKQIFLRSFNEDGGLRNEILYLQNQNDGDALISSLGFPFINLNLDPLGNTMRNKKHLTILEAGGKFLAAMLDLGFKNMFDPSANVSVQCKIKKHVNFGQVYEVVITNNDYSFAMKSTGGEHSLRSFCNAQGVPEYKVLEINNALNNFDDDIANTQLLLPNYYAKVIKMEVRKSDYMPVKIALYDEKGLYAQYAYDYYKVNPVLPSIVFDRDNPAYTF